MGTKIKKPVVYIAAPMRDVPEYNFPAFDEAEAWLEKDFAEQGALWTIVSPANIDRSRGISDTSGVGTPTGLEVFQGCMKIDLAIVAGAAAVLLLKGWENSEGANREVFVANSCGVQLWIATYDEDGRMNGYYMSPPIDPPLIGAVAPKPAVGVGGETRVVDPNTGGAKGSKPAQLASIDPLAILAIARVGGMGAEKYDTYNYLKGYDWLLSFNAAFRHLLLMLAGEDFDEESGLPHAAHAGWNCMALVSFLLRGIGSDTRPPPVDPAVYHALVSGAPLAGVLQSLNP
jgi:hypothetical protein